MVEQRINSEVIIKVLCETHERPSGLSLSELVAQAAGWR